MLASSTSSLQGSRDKTSVTTFSIQLLHRLLEDNLDVVRVWSLASRSWSSSSRSSSTAGMSFHVRGLIGKVVDEDEDGIPCSFCFIATSFTVLDGASSKWIGFLCSSRSSVTYFVTTPADHYQGLGSVSLHKMDLNFNYTTDKVSRDLDLQYWTNYGVALNSSFWFGSVIISRMWILSTWVRAAKSCQVNVVSCNNELSRWDISYKTSVIASFQLLKKFWEVRMSLCTAAPSFVRLPCWTLVVW